MLLGTDKIVATSGCSRLGDRFWPTPVCHDVVFHVG